MNPFYTTSLTILLVSLIWPALWAQPYLELSDCGVSYIDPQDEISNAQNRDTLFYSTLFDEPQTTYNYWVDINAFGGQQVDRTVVYAILEGGELKQVAELAFGNCVDCSEGFTLIHDGAVVVEQVMDVNTMNLWIQSQGQPPFTLTGNLQTLAGVGRLSGQMPFCAIGMRVEYSVFSDPANSSTEFATHILCPEPVVDCSFDPQVLPNCQADNILCFSNIPDGCFSDEVTVSWSNQNGILSNDQDVLLPLTGNEGMLYLEITDECCTILDSFLIEFPDFAEAGPDLVACQAQPFEIAGSGGMDHFWELPDGTTSSDSLLVFSAITGSDEGLYILHAFDENGCEDTDSLLLTVEVPDNPIIEYTPACLGDTLFLFLLNDTAYADYQWVSPEGFNIPFDYVSDFQLSDAGTYSLRATTTAGCQIINTIDVMAAALPTFDYIIEESCDSATVYLIPDTLSYSWGLGNTGNVITTATGGTFQLTITDAVGCSVVENIVVPIPDGPEVILDVDQPICPGELGSIEIQLHSEERIAIFSIDGGLTYSVSDQFNELSPGDYDLVIQDDLGCIQNFFVEIIAPDTMGVSLDQEDLEVRPGTPVEFAATTIGDIVFYQWIPDEIDSGLPTTSFTATNNLDIRILVEDSKGCVASASLQLDVVVGDIYVPTAISPNGDGRNDKFTFYSDGKSDEVIELLQVYNRWGGMIFEAREIPINAESFGWDGTREGEPLNTGLYTFHGTVRFGNGFRRQLKGDIQLVR
jgi:gliding motility-associated-like protein